MRVLILDTNYPAFTDEFWRAHPELSSATYETAWRALMDECFGTADFYSFNLRALGHEASEVVSNDERLQRLWARENDLRLPDESKSWRLTRRRKIIPWVRQEQSQQWVEAVMRAQIEAFAPDVLYVQDVHFVSSEFLREIKPRVRLIAGQIASPLGTNDLSVYDVVFTSFPHFGPQLEQRGTRGRYFSIGFEARILEKLTKEPPHFGAVFGGGLSGAHSKRTLFLEEVARRVPLDVWGYGVETLSRDSPLRARHHGTAWGLAMYRALHDAKISLNIHIDVAQNNANNMRLYEATGVGSLLLTDEKDNLNELFEVDREVVSFRDDTDCADKIAYFLEHETERRAIAKAGQARTLREHTYARRMEELVVMLEEELERSQR